MHHSLNILIIDDDPTIGFTLKSLLSEVGMKSVECCTKVEDANKKLRNHHYQLVFLDLVMDGGINVPFIQEVKNTQPHCLTVIITGEEDIHLAKACLQGGAFDYLRKPILPEMLYRTLDHVNHEFFPDAMPLRNAGKTLPKCAEKIVGHDRLMKETLVMARQLGQTLNTILIEGESGTGKELIADYIHCCSGVTGQFIKVNVAGLDDVHFSDTLFGHLPRSFTGIEQQRSGLVEQAKNGTLLLDEIGDLRPESQVKLLRLIQNFEYYPLGSDQIKPCTARLLFATHGNLQGNRILNSF